MTTHSFDTEIAAIVGVNAATIYQNVVFWAEKNIANGRHIHDGYAWTYNSVKAMTVLFPYLSKSQIKTAISKLVEAGLVVEGNYNKTGWDRTKWIGIPHEKPSKEAKSPICQKSPMDLSEIANGFVRNRQPIPDSKPDSNTDGKQGRRQNHIQSDLLPDFPQAPIASEKPPPGKERIPEGWVPSDENRAYALSKNLTDAEIEEIANEFQAYWSDRTDRDSRKSQRGWAMCWQNHIRRVGEGYRKNRRVAFKANPGGHRQGGSIASVVAQREVERKN